MSRCLTTLELEQLLTGTLDPNRQAHLAGCSVCQSERDRILENNQLIAELQQVPLQTVAQPAGHPIETVDGYEILAEIQRGGQGIVYQAIQKSTNRTVALKILVGGSPFSAQRRRRFEREIELVASMRHPAVVTIYDSGVTTDGTPYYAMEYLEGSCLFESDSPSGQPTTNALLRFVKICEAVNHAHQRGVIHRDLKPSNIIIDRQGEPCILDFGIAKAVASDSVDLSRLSATGQFLGTLAYASPEQLGEDPSAVDVRTDVYSLGVILYELLTGGSPYRASSNVAEMVKAIVEQEPRPPSLQQAAPPSLKIGDELDTIVHQALSKNPDRRYQTAGELGRDIARFLRGEPIDAKRDSGWYVIRKTLQRYQGRVFVAAGFAVLTVLSTIALAVLWQNATHATARQKQETQTADRTSDFLQNLLEANDPSIARGRHLTVRELLDLAAERMDSELQEEPEVLADLHRTIGKAYFKLELLARAEFHLEKALEMHRALSTSDKDIAEALLAMGVLRTEQGQYENAALLLMEAKAMFQRLGDEFLNQQGQALCALAFLHYQRRDYDTADSLNESALALFREHPELNVEALVTNQNLQAILLRERGEFAMAEHRFLQALASHEELGHRPDLVHARIQLNLAKLLLELERLDQALIRLHDAHSVYVALHGEEHPVSLLCAALIARAELLQSGPASAQEWIDKILDQRTMLAASNKLEAAQTQQHLVVLLEQTGRLEDAEAVCREAVANCERLGVLEQSISLRATLATLLQQSQRIAEARALAESVVDDLARRSPVASPSLGWGKLSLARCLSALGEQSKSKSLVREAVEMFQDHYQSPHSAIAQALHDAAEIFYRCGEFNTALNFGRQALAMRIELYGEFHRHVERSTNVVGVILTSLGEYEEAEQLFLDALDLTRDLYGAEHAFVAEKLFNLGRVDFDRGEWESASGYFAQALELRQSLVGDHHPEVIEATNFLGLCHYQLRQYEQAAKLFQSAVSASRVIYPKTHPEIATSLFNLATCSLELGKLEQGTALLEESYVICSNALGPDADMTRRSAQALSYVYQRSGHPEKAAEINSLPTRWSEPSPSNRDAHP